MADRAFMKCPFCRNMGNASAPEMFRDNVDFFCMLGHRAPHAQVMAMSPELVKTEVHFKPGPNDVKAEIWVNGEVLIKAKEVMGERFHPTIASLIRCCMAGEPVMIDGIQAEKLRKLGIKNGAEMVAVAEQNKQLAGENEGLVSQINEWESRFKDAMAGVR
jgi:hypothetical protein